jgi:putative intracellular protease/amidase
MPSFRMKIFTLLAAAILLLSPVHAAEKKPILLVLTNHGELGQTGERTGFFLGEAAHPWEVFTAAGYDVRLASPRGGFAPLDAKSFDLDDPANAAFWKKFGAEKEGQRGIPETLALDKVDPTDYSAVFFAGGHGTMWDFADSAALQKVTAAIYEQGGAVGAVCHGPAALVNVRLKDGKPLVAGRKVAVFTNSEEEAVELTDVVPFLLETELTNAGATVVPAPDFSENAIRDGRLVTGQNPASAKKAATLLLEALSGS